MIKKMHSGNNRRLAAAKSKTESKLGVFVYLTLLLSRNQAPELVNVDRRAVKLIQGLVEVTHANFAEITRVTGGRRENAECRGTWTNMYCMRNERVQYGTSKDHKKNVRKDL